MPARLTSSRTRAIRIATPQLQLPTRETESAGALGAQVAQGEGGVQVRTPPSVVSGIAEAILLVLLVALPAAIDPAGVLAIEPIKASLLRAGAALLAAAWLADRLTGAPRVDVGAHPVIRAGLALVDRKSTRLNSSHIPLSRM